MFMSKTTMRLEDTGAFSSLLTDYLNGSEKLMHFYAFAPSMDGMEKAMSACRLPANDRKVLVEALKQQYQGMSVSAKTGINIDLLASENAYTVTTGHQLCLFTGPLYFLYKIITTINLAKELKKAFPKSDFIPVYWMASEDHDFEEVNHVNIYGKKLVWEQDKKGAVGDIPTDTIAPLIEQLTQMLGNEPHAKQLLELLRTAYLSNDDLAAATRVLVNELFGEHGLVVLDGASPALKKIFASEMRDDIFIGSAGKLVNESISELKNAGVGAQVTPRAINLFYMRDGLRERIEQEADRYKVLNTNISFSRDEVETELQEHPERFSPNVVLRPLYQQRILPNLAYIGGPGEIAYWFEYKKMFGHYGIFFPVLMPRNFVMLFDAGVRERLGKLDISKEQLFAETESLIKEFVGRNAGDSLDITSEEEELKKLYSGLAAKAEKIDPTLATAVEAELQKQLNALKALQGKLMRAEKQRQETSVNQLRKIKEKLFPAGSLQERYDNFIPYYARHGKEFITMLMNELSPFEQSMLLIDID